eukprot:GHRQ01030947.1.p1 GENE.GHRQ01030947.1~~GHRQ01030947.1.p1  ORF type:complete len:119 (+),score=39.87 GHRQ01030947.1:260-616(+)
MPLTMHAAAAALQLRIICPDSPGIGGSSQLPQRTVQHYPADVAEICQQLELRQFSVMASSAGAMYALALTLAPETRGLIVGKVGCTARQQSVLQADILYLYLCSLLDAVLTVEGITCR